MVGGGGGSYRPMFAIATFAVIGRSFCLVLDDYAKLLFTPFRIAFIYLPSAVPADAPTNVTPILITQKNRNILINSRVPRCAIN